DINLDQKSMLVPFKDLIDATGVSRSIAKYLEPYGVKFKEAFKSHFKNMVSGYLRVERRDGKDIELPEKTIFTFTNTKGYLLIYFNKSSHSKSKKKQLKFYVTM